MSIEMKLPELGENIESGDVLRVMVKPGDSIKKDQPVLELETDKATIEVPSSAEGVITEVRVKAGEKVAIGQVIFVVEEGQRAEGKGQKADEPKRKAEIVEMNRPKPLPAPAPVTAAALATNPLSIPAAPATRRLARELGVNIQDVHGSGQGGRISTDDVTAYARGLLAGAHGGGRAAAPAPLPDFSIWGPVERKPMSGVRRTTAHRLTQAWNTVPHVFQHDRADITSADALRQRLSKKAEADGRAPVTITALLMKVLATAVRKFPQANASVDVQTDEIIYKQYVHIGVAVDTDRGLLVPVIRDADQKDVFQLADEIAQAAQKARARKLSPADMQGGSITISNLGGLGAGPFTPIVNWPEVAILGVARARMEPVFVNGQFEPRLLMPLTLSYDHRVVDGADGARLIRWVVEAVEQPALIWLDV
ncbi:MAG: 2-oxo acid dehydrogenase subunit E2 [Acidobacteria bacterium]|nr:2-oxo acid dehydrogenase subunit E2 [Acidobacteriota bacterium]